MKFSWNQSHSSREEPETTDEKKQRKGAYAWKVVHTYSNTTRECWNPFNAQRFFFHVFWNLIPKEGCSCSEFFVIYCSAHPPDFSTAEKFFTWTWEVHNAVNAKLGKPEIEWNEACNLWNWNPQKE
jgi:hypothetical protein